MANNIKFNFDKEFSFLKLIISIIFRVIASITLGPIIAVILFLLWLIALGQGSVFASYITEGNLVGYWFVIITLLIFGLVWLEYINKRKDSSLSSIKCHKWWTEYWIFSKSQSKNVIQLPNEAEEHFKVKIIKMDKKLAWILGLLVLSVMGIIVAIIIYFTRDSVKSLVPPELKLSEFHWLGGFLIFILIAFLSLILAFYFIYNSFYLTNKEHYYWKRFWIGIILYTIRQSYSEFIEGTKESEAIFSFIEGFKSNYKSITTEIESSMSEIDMTLDQKVWLENKLEELENSPSFLIPSSLALISTFYGFTLLIAGSFGHLIIGPATEFLRFISGLFL